MEIKLNQQTDALPVVEAERDTELREPTLYHVVLLNDDYTPMDFVIEVIMRLFQKDYPSAFAIMMQVHERGRGIAGTYPKEIAEEKVAQVTYAAGANEYPLTSVIEAA